MGIFGFGKKKQNTKDTVEPERSFTYSVCDRFALKDSTDVVVVGRLNGTLHVGDAVYVANPGDENTPVTVTTVAGLEQGDANGRFTRLQEASNMRVSVCLSNCANVNIKPGTVLHARAATVGDVHAAYINAIGDTYIQAKQAVLTEEDLEKMSITDLAETWRLLNYVMSQKQEIPPKLHEENYAKIGKMAEAMISRLYELDHIYVVFHKMTNEPNLYSRTIKRENGYECTPPDIMVVTEAYQSVYAKSYENTELELRKIENGADKKGIYNFLQTSFFVNGAQGVDFLFPQAGISSEKFMPAPDYSGMREVDIPVTNPDVERWILLLAQLGEPQTEDQKLIYRLYYGFLSRELVKAKFVVPMRFAKGTPVRGEGDEEGTVTLKKDTTFELPLQEGKNGRKAVHFYTDWLKLRQVYEDGWDGMIQTIGQVIDVYDVVINVTKFPRAGCYISKEMFDDMKKRV